MQTTTEICLIRHAPVARGLLCGRTDADAVLEDHDEKIEALRLNIGEYDVLMSSPAKRCVQTANAFWPGATPEYEELFWEQDFGQWEGVPYSKWPDLGGTSLTMLATTRPPNGESFQDVVERVRTAMDNHMPAWEAKKVVIFAHAGTIRSMLAITLDSLEMALCFHVSPLSLTRICMSDRKTYSIRSVNERPAY